MDHEKLESSETNCIFYRLNPLRLRNENVFENSEFQHVAILFGYQS